MKTFHYLALAAVAALLSACLPSVHPFYTEKDLLQDNRLVGEWQTGDAPDKLETWKFEEDGDKKITLTIKDKDQKEGTFSARLFKLGEERFLDLVPKDCSYATNQVELVNASMFPGHLLTRIQIKDQELKMAFFDFDWLAKELKEKPAILAHYQEDERLLLTAPTLDLQNFVLKNMDKLFAELNTFKRITPKVR